MNGALRPLTIKFLLFFCRYFLLMLAHPVPFIFHEMPFYTLLLLSARVWDYQSPHLDLQLSPSKSPWYLLQLADYDNGCYDAASVAEATTRVSRGHSLLSEHQVSSPYDWNEMFWIIHELQMPLCGYINMPLRPHGISHSHFWENNKDKANRFLSGYVLLLSTICPCLHLWRVLGLCVFASYFTSVLCLIPHFIFLFHVMQSSKLLLLLKFS